MSKPIISEDNPALAFISSTNAEDTAPAAKAKTKTAKKPVKKVDNTGKKNYRINLALTPALGERVKQEAEEQDRSVNKFIELVLLDYFNKIK